MLRLDMHVVHLLCVTKLIWHSLFQHGKDWWEYDIEKH